MANTLIYPEQWVTKLQEQLDEPNKFKKICKVEYTNSRVLNNPYLADETVQTGTRGNSYSPAQISETNESITINTFKLASRFIDRADLAQSSFTTIMGLAERQGVLLNEAIESAVYGDHTNRTDFGAGDITGGTVADTTTITVSSTNIDDIIRHLKRVVRVANGESFLNRYGMSIVWRPSDFEVLEGFLQANGFASADRFLQDGIGQGINYMGVTHYSSNLLTANHVYAGVNNVYHLGIVKDTYGQIMVNDKDLNLQSGVTVTSRVDYAIKAWTVTKPILFDVNVA